MKRLEAAEEARYRAGLQGAARAGLTALTRTGSALEGVVAATLFMEDSGDFNAGAGSCLDEDGNATLDAALMRGSDLAAGAVGALTGTKNAILVCRDLLEEGKHVLLVGPGADRRARALGLPPLPPVDERRRKVWQAMLEERRSTGKEPRDRLAATSRPSTRLSAVSDLGTVTEAESHDTVGAVAVDDMGRVAAAVSTGGLWLKAVGRVGDSAIVAGGIYASDALGGAAVATGIGEKILRVALCKEAVDLLSNGSTAQEAAEGAIALITGHFGGDTAGLIVVDCEGRIGAAFDTRGMGRACARGNDVKVAVWGDESL
jgi:beta-aspartyl-peptidase (threonine type)